MAYLSKPKLLAGLLCLFVLCSSCGTENKPVYTLSVNVSPAEAGEVIQSQMEAEEGDSIQVTAIANEHWVFTGWGGDLSGTTEAAVYVHMDRDRIVTALFEKQEYPLTVEIEGGGSVDQEIIQAKTTDYPHGTLVKLTAVPDTGWEFVGWSGDADGENDEIEILIDGETTIGVEFRLIDYELVVETEGEGSVEQKVIQAKTTEYPYGTMIELTALPEYGWQFVKWEGDVEDTENSITEILIDGDKQVKAIFERVDFILTVEIEGEGSVEQEIVQGKSTDYTFGTQVQLSAVPETGWEFVEWQGAAAGSDSEIVITVDEDKEIKAVFKRMDFQLTIQVNGQGSVSQQVVQAKTTSYSYQTEVQLTATPETGWSFVSWSGDASGTNNTIVVNMDGNKQVSSNFEQITQQLTVQVNGQGSVSQQSASGSGSVYPYGTLVQLTAIPANGWAFAGWSGDLQSPHNPVGIEMTQNRTITVNFVPTPAQKRILPLGDSITNGVPYSYRYHLNNMLVNAGYNFQYVGTRNTNPANYPGAWDQTHEGHNGQRTFGINAELSNWLGNYSLDIALIHLGTNDVLQTQDGSFDVNASINALDSIINKLRGKNQIVRIYLAKIIPVSDSADSPSKQYNAKINQWNNAVESFAAGKSTGVSPIKIVNMHSGMTNADYVDGIHPTDSAAHVMAQRWFNTLTGN